MTHNDSNGHRPRKRKLTVLVLLVAFVFIVLFISVSSAGVLMFVMYRLGMMQPLSMTRFPILIAFLLVISLFVAIILTSLAGNISLRPLHKLVDATKEIAAGNYAVRVEAHGPEEYNRLVTSFNEMAEELGSVETLRDDFVSSISHEYKTPVVSIRGFAKLLKRDDLPQGTRDEYLDIIISEADRLVQLSSNVLLLSKLNAADTATQVEAYALDEQLRRVAAVLSPQLARKQITLEADLAECMAEANQEQMQQVWINLLGNAIKFTPEGGRIDITLAHDDTYARAVIRDTGIGMSPQTQRRAFDKFYQGDASRAAQGNGLGLSLVWRIVTLHGGEVAVASEEGKGSAFTVTLPLRQP